MMSLWLVGVMIGPSSSVIQIGRYVKLIEA